MWPKIILPTITITIKRPGPPTTTTMKKKSTTVVNGVASVRPPTTPPETVVAFLPEVALSHGQGPGHRTLEAVPNASYGYFLQRPPTQANPPCVALHDADHDDDEVGAAGKAVHRNTGLFKYQGVDQFGDLPQVHENGLRQDPLLQIPCSGAKTPATTSAATDLTSLVHAVTEGHNHNQCLHHHAYSIESTAEEAFGALGDEGHDQPFVPGPDQGLVQQVQGPDQDRFMHGGPGDDGLPPQACNGMVGVAELDEPREDPLRSEDDLEPPPEAATDPDTQLECGSDGDEEQLALLTVSLDKGTKGDFDKSGLSLVDNSLGGSCSSSNNGKPNIVPETAELIPLAINWYIYIEAQRPEACNRNTATGSI